MSNHTVIGGRWPLEGFVSQKNARAGIRFGFIGAGQGGGKIVDVAASVKDQSGKQIYPAIAFNSNLGDMAKLVNLSGDHKIPLKGFETGVGKDPEVGLEAFLAPGNASTIFEAVEKYMSDCQVLFVAATFGGGTGTGALNALADALSIHLGIPVIALVSLPQPNEIESANAHNAIVQLAPKLNRFEKDADGHDFRLLEGLVIIDNEKIIKDHMNDPEVKNFTWDQYSNNKLIATLHEWSVLTTLESDFTVDAADLFNHVMTGGGVLTFAKKKINLDDVAVKNADDLINAIVSTYRSKNILANDFDYANDMRAMAMVIVMPEKRVKDINVDTLERIREKIKNELPDIAFYPGAVTNNSNSNAIVYTMAKMGGLPPRALGLRTEAEALKALRLEKEKLNTGFHVGEAIASEPKRVGRRKPSGTPFSTASESTPSTEPTKPIEETKAKPAFNPFAKL